MGREPRCPWCKPEDPIGKCRKEEKLSKSGCKRVEAIVLEPLLKMESLVLKIPTKENTRLRFELPCTNSRSEEMFHVTLSFNRTRRIVRERKQQLKF